MHSLNKFLFGSRYLVYLGYKVLFTYIIKVATKLEIKARENKIREFCKIFWKIRILILDFKEI